MISDYLEQLDAIITTSLTGSVVRTEGIAAAVADFPAPVGAIVAIQRQTGEPVLGEVIGFRDNLTLVYPLHELTGVRRGNLVRLCRTARRLPVGEDYLGRIIDAHGQPLDGRPAPVATARVRLTAAPPPAITRPRIQQPLSTGIRAIDSMLTCGTGQRMGVFAGAGVGKSVMLGMMARYCAADVNVIGLIGERGREVNEFLERDLGPEGLQRSVVVVATSDQPALLRVQAALAATAIAEYFRDQGRSVLLIMDSLTRFALAQREIGLAAGEPPTTRGFPPSVFAHLPRLVERAGRSDKGSITAFYSVLVEGDDTNEPVADTVRGLLDGHTILSRKIAARGHYPAIDMLDSISRLQTEICPAEQIEAAQTVREMLAVYRDHEDLIAIGAYRAGTNPLVDAAIKMREPIAAFLRQGIRESANLADAQTELRRLAQQCAALRTARPAATGKQAS